MSEEEEEEEERACGIPLLTHLPSGATTLYVDLHPSQLSIWE
jgi:hypothetical protein